MSGDPGSSAAPTPIPALILGGSGYVAGELLRLLAGHPGLRPAAVLSTSRAGTKVAATFPHLAGAYPQLAFTAPPAGDGLAALLDRLAASESPGDGRLAIFSALPHGAAAAEIDRLLTASEAAGGASGVAPGRLALVDLSADFRHPDPERYAAIYGQPHGAPERLPLFTCALPEHVDGVPVAAAGGPRAIAHPGCFTTAVVLAARPLIARRLTRGPLAVTAVTGSTGAGREPRPATHHPARRSNLFAYQPLTHRHRPEMERLAAAGDPEAAVEVLFVPCSGPHARGIYAIVQAELVEERSAGEVAAALTEFYAGSPFVTVSPSAGESSSGGPTSAPPQLTEVVGSNRARLGVSVAGRRLVVTSAIDNLVKGAAGGAVQWMNRLLGLPETAGLTAPGLGWF